MKRAQAIVEYIILSVITLCIAAVVLWSFNISNIAAIGVFGVKTNDKTITIPAMTP